MPIDPITGGALISAGGNLLGNIFGNIGARRRQRENNRFNVDFWRMQNAYNHPKEQMARLREAGLNPNLIYGTSPSSAVGNAEKIAPSQTAPYNFDNPLKDAPMLLQMKQTAAQTNNLEAQNKVIVQDAILRSLQSANEAVKHGRSSLELDIAKELKQTSIDAAKQNLKLLQENTVAQQIDNTVRNATVAAKIKEMWYRSELVKEQFSGQQLENALKRLEKEWMQLGLTKNDPYYFRIFARQGEGNFPDILNNVIKNEERKRKERRAKRIARKAAKGGGKAW